MTFSLQTNLHNCSDLMAVFYIKKWKKIEILMAILRIVAVTLPQGRINDEKKVQSGERINNTLCV
jgi:hypothetical protein